VTVINASVLETISPALLQLSEEWSKVPSKVQFFSLSSLTTLLEVILFSQAHFYADDVQIYASGQLNDADTAIEKLNADREIFATGHMKTVFL
jgi:hypothetical protein